MGTWYTQAPVGGRYFRNKKKGSSPTTGRKKNPTYGTAHQPTTDNAVHPLPTHRPNLYYIQQYSSAAVLTAVHLVRGEQLVGWFLRTLYDETGNKRRQFHIFLTLLGHLGERASRHPPPTHGPTQYSTVQQCSSTWSNTPDRQAAAGSLVTMLSGWAGFAIVYYLFPATQGAKRQALAWPILRTSSGDGWTQL